MRLNAFFQSRIAGVTYPRSILTHPARPRNRAEVVYDLKGALSGPKRFRAVVGIEAAVGGEGACTFIVEAETAGERKQLFKSGVLRGNGGAKAVDVTLGNAEKLILRADGGGSIDADHAAWGGARLMAAE